jgi:hypothetical protein
MASADSASTTSASSPTAYDIQDALVHYGDWIQSGHWFYDTIDECWLYSTSALEDSIVCRYGTEHESPQDSDGPATTELSVLEIEGGLEAGYLIGFPADSTREIDGARYTCLGSRLLVTADADCDTPLNPTSTGHQQSLRHISPEPASLATVDEIPECGERHLIVAGEQPSKLDDLLSQPSEGASGPDYGQANPTITTQYVDTADHPKDTFSEPALRQFAEHWSLPGRVLNAFAGWEELDIDGAETVRNDINPERPAEYHMDAAALPTIFEPESFSTIIADFPWTAYQATYRYAGYTIHKECPDSVSGRGKIRHDVRDLPYEVPGQPDSDASAGGQQTLAALEPDTDPEDTIISTDEDGKEQVGHAALIKRAFDYLLEPGGRVIQLAYTGTNMPGRLSYNRLAREVFEPYGQAKALIGAVDEK